MSFDFLKFYIAEINTILSWYIFFLYFVGFNWLYFVENFRIYDNGKYWSTVFFLVISLLGFGVRAMMEKIRK